MDINEAEQSVNYAARRNPFAYSAAFDLNNGNVSFINENEDIAQTFQSIDQLKMLDMPIVR